jgi:predicted ATPase/DNA-binding CsgD family transcriptional regulator
VNGTVFVGREDELAELTALLSRGRLITLTGTGGVGKTRLALEAASRVRARFPDGVYAASFSALSDPAFLPSAVAAALGLPGDSTVPAQDAVVRYLHGREVLLVLDTCEHVLDACAALAEPLLLQVPGVTLLATSRQPLDVAGEILCPLAPLSVPAAGAGPVPGDAVDLFTRRARMAWPGFALTDGNTGDVIELCRRLDGIPLALELAASQIRDRPLTDLARQPPGASAARGGQRPADHRHQTMESAIAWSYSLCTPAERALWERASVFAGLFGIEAAEETCAGADLRREDVLTAIISLVDKSVLFRESPTGVTGPGRYRMLDTIRDFGARRLSASGARDITRARLISRYLAQATAFAAHLLDEKQVPCFRDLRGEQDSLRAALGYALDGHVPAGESAQLITSLSWYWHVGGQYQEGISWTDRLLRLFPADGGPDAVIQRAIVLIARCALGSTGGQPEQAAADGREAIRLARQSGLEPVLPQARLYLTNALFLTGDYDAAIETATVAGPGLEAAGDRLGLIILGLYMINLYQLKGDYARSGEWYERTAGMLDVPGDRWLTGWLHLMGGYTLYHLGDDAECTAECAAALRQAISAKDDIGDISGVAFALELLACLEQRAGRYERGAWLIGAASSLWDRAVARLAGNAVMEAIREDFILQARERLGAERYDEVFGLGAQAPHEQAVRFALSDAAGFPGPGAAPDGADTAAGLTPREREVAALAGTGLSNREIAEQLVVSKRTVDSHMVRIYAKLGVSSRAGLARWRRAKP